MIALQDGFYRVWIDSRASKIIVQLHSGSRNVWTFSYWLAARPHFISDSVFLEQKWPNIDFIFLRYQKECCFSPVINLRKFGQGWERLDGLEFCNVVIYGRYAAVHWCKLRGSTIAHCGNDFYWRSAQTALGNRTPRDWEWQTLMICLWKFTVEHKYARRAF